MTMLDRLRESLPGARRGASVPLEAPEPAELVELRRQRDELAERVAELHWDLGGLTYEMAVRDHFRLDVLVRKAAALQEVDAQLGEVERLLRLEDWGEAGACRNCGAPHGRGAVYCWQCGQPLMAVAEVGGTGGTSSAA